MAAVRGLGDAVEQVRFPLTDLKAAKPCISEFRMAVAGRNGLKLAGRLLEFERDRCKVPAGILGKVDFSVLAGRIDPDRVSGLAGAGRPEAGWNAAQLSRASIGRDAIGGRAGQCDQTVILRSEE